MGDKYSEAASAVCVNSSYKEELIPGRSKQGVHSAMLWVSGSWALSKLELSSGKALSSKACTFVTNKCRVHSHDHEVRSVCRARVVHNEDIIHCFEKELSLES